MQLPGCITSGPCYSALAPNSWRKTWPSWTGLRGKWQGGRRLPQAPTCNHPGLKSAERAQQALCSPGTSHRLVKKTGLKAEEQRTLQVLQRETEEPQSGSFPRGSRGEPLAEDHWSSMWSAFELYFKSHICFKHLCLIDLLFSFMQRDFLMEPNHRLNLSLLECFTKLH